MIATIVLFALLVGLAVAVVLRLGLERRRRRQLAYALSLEIVDTLHSVESQNLINDLSRALLAVDDKFPVRQIRFRPFVIYNRSKRALGCFDLDIARDIADVYATWEALPNEIKILEDLWVHAEFGRGSTTSNLLMRANRADQRARTLLQKLRHLAA